MPAMERCDRPSDRMRLLMQEQWRQLSPRVGTRQAALYLVVRKPPVGKRGSPEGWYSIRRSGISCKRGQEFVSVPRCLREQLATGFLKLRTAEVSPLPEDHDLPEIAAIPHPSIEGPPGV
jgi:hypothetical protein